MVKLIQDIWIIQSDGIVLFSRVFHQNIEDQLFGALLSALDSFAQELSEGGLSNFEMGDLRFTIIKRFHIIFIANSSRKVKESKIITELNNISNKFFNKYPKKFLENWDKDVSVFINFKEEIDDALENPVKKFWDGF
jgi:hypothetical protein